MEELVRLNKLIEKTIRENWELDALTDYKGIALQYKEVARKIAKIHLMYEQCGLKQGDKVAICGRNSAHWGVAFLATLTYGAVAVPILHEFKADNVHRIVNHSEARVLFAGDAVWENLDAQEMPNLDCVVLLTDFSLPVSRLPHLLDRRDHLNEMYGQRYPKDFGPTDIHYYENSADELAVINYTSGTTSDSKGVMLPYRSLESNVAFAEEVVNLPKGAPVVSMLPMAHMYGMAFEFLYEFTKGCHVYFLTRVPSPQIIFNALAEIKPRVIIAVPLIIEKIIKKKVMPLLETPSMKILLNLPYVNSVVRGKIRQQMIDAFGGNFMEVIVGGAAFNQEVEKLLKDIQFPYTVGYGMTECGPIICYEDWKTFAMTSCGKAAPRMEVKVLSADPQHEVGEIVCRGANLMLGYYKNEKATAAAIDADGWLHTGDLGIIDAEGNVFIKGRSKNMLLGPSGQNIYPEEIEDKLNNMTYVSESIVVQRGEKLVGLVYPDFDDAFKQGLSEEDLAKVMEQNRVEVNAQLPAYEQISAIEIYQEEFEKTPKKSIKRFLYK